MICFVTNGSNTVASAHVCGPSARVRSKHRTHNRRKRVNCKQRMSRSYISRLTPAFFKPRWPLGTVARLLQTALRGWRGQCASCTGTTAIGTAEHIGQNIRFQNGFISNRDPLRPPLEPPPRVRALPAQRQMMHRHASQLLLRNNSPAFLACLHLWEISATRLAKVTATSVPGSMELQFMRSTAKI